MILEIFTLVHVLISLVGIGTGFVVIFGMLASKRLNGWTKWFLWMTVATSVTGFFFPFHGFKPSYVVGALSLVLLTFAIKARYRHPMLGGWRVTYVVTAVVSQYLNVFVLIVQSFMKVPLLHALAPTQTEPPFKIAQLATLIVFIALGIASVKKFHPQLEQ